MKNKLANALKNYYLKQKNKIIFKNGMTLNLFAWKMAEELDFHGIDPSVLSRVLNGKRLFTPKQLNVFCHILHIRKKEKNLLEKALQQNVLERCGLKPKIYYFKSSKIPSLILKYLVKYIYKLRVKGSPKEAIEIASFLEKIAIILKNKYPLEWKKNIKIFAWAYNEKSRAWGEIATYKDVLSLMLPDAKKAILVGKKLKDHHLLNMAYMNIGGAQYVAKKWQCSADYLETKFKKVDIDTQIEFLRTLALDYAFLNKKIQFKKVRKKAIKIIEERKFSNLFNIVSLLEALSRGLALLKFSQESLSTLDNAEKLCLKAERKYGNTPFFESQIIRAKIFVLSSSPKINKDQLIEIAREGLKPKFKIYKRHQQQILQLIKKLNILDKCL